LKKAFLDSRFKDQETKVQRAVIDAIPYAKMFSILHFDNVTRSKAWGYNCANDLYRSISCGAFISYIDKPFLVINAKDDPICQYGDVPHVDILSNKNAMLVECDFGGHCDFFT
jgi:predicted alpha/beta-fold hydrolase